MSLANTPATPLKSAAAILIKTRGLFSFSYTDCFQRFGTNSERKIKVLLRHDLIIATCPSTTRGQILCVLPFHQDVPKKWVQRVNKQEPSVCSCMEDVWAADRSIEGLGLAGGCARVPDSSLRPLPSLIHRTTSSPFHLTCLPAGFSDLLFCVPQCGIWIPVFTLLQLVLWPTESTPEPSSS